jgi:hypothetical protein
MVRVAVLNLSGDFEKGFTATLQIGQAGKASSSGWTGKLPGDRDLEIQYKKWRSRYICLGNKSRALRDVEGETTHFSSLQSCHQAALQLQKKFNQWLNSENFSVLKKLIENTNDSEEIRLIIQNNEIDLLRRLPWHLWNVIVNSHIEVALSSPAYELPERTQRLRCKPRILAIIGSSEGINIEFDRQLLEKLGQQKNAEIVFLVEPQQKEIYKALWNDDKGWDILFFAGHGSSNVNGRQGRIYINKSDSLSIGDLNDALKTAIQRGLKLAIFNSCEGLGLVKELENLHIPQVIVMKEPVPDEVAQKFMKYFLEYFTNGESLYMSVRKARENLRKIENNLPSASWLPIICQNPAEIPLTWQELTPPKFEYVSRILESILHGIISSQEASKTTNTTKLEINTENETDLKNSDPIHLTSVSEFWSGNLSKGQLVVVEGALSQYAPMFIGSPKLKREVHRGYRKAIPFDDSENQQQNSGAISANLSFTAGQMVLRLRPEETANDWVYMGLYHSIIRNSIPVFVTQEYYQSQIKNLFERDGDRIAYVVEAKLTGRLIAFPSNFMQEFIERNNIKSYIRPELISDIQQEILAIFVDGNNTAIEYKGKPRYLDGDIWVALKSGVEEFFVIRFIDLSDVADVRRETRALAIEARELYPDGEIIYQFDQVEKLIPGHQSVDSMIERFTRLRRDSNQ